MRMEYAGARDPTHVPGESNAVKSSAKVSRNEARLGIVKVHYRRGEGKDMPHNEVKKTIGELKSELEQTPKETTLFEELLEQAREGIERYTPEALQELVETLHREAEEFELEHPRITALINQVTTSLSNLGI